MAPRVPRIVFTVALGYTLALLPEVSGADEKDTKPAVTKDTSSKPPDFSKYTFVADAVGEIVKADDKSLTLRITWLEPQVKGNNNRRPPLHQNNRNFHNPYAGRQQRPPQVTVKEVKHDYTLEFVPESLVRTKKLPPKTDDKGKTVDYTAQEIQDLRGKWAIPGYAASTADLVPGTIVEVYVIRDKSIAAEKVTEADLRVKYAVILGKDPNPPKDVATPKGDKKDKKN